MAIRDRVFAITDKPMTWTRAIVLGLVIWTWAILALGQLPSWIIYWFDAEVVRINELTQGFPIIGPEGLEPAQIEIVRDLVANGAQMSFFIGALIFAYYWQKTKQKRLGLRGHQDTVKGYMSGK